MGSGGGKVEQHLYLARGGVLAYVGQRLLDDAQKLLLHDRPELGAGRAIGQAEAGFNAVGRLELVQIVAQGPKKVLAGSILCVQPQDKVADVGMGFLRSLHDTPEIGPRRRDLTGS